MSQSYFPTSARTTSPSPLKDSGLVGEKQFKVEDVQEAYIEQKDR